VAFDRSRDPVSGINSKYGLPYEKIPAPADYSAVRIILRVKNFPFIFLMVNAVLRFIAGNVKGIVNPLH